MRPKCQYVLCWQNYRLHTKDSVSKWNSAVDKHCVLCTNQIEDRDHLFFKCLYSRQLLEENINNIRPNYGNSVEFNQILENLCSNQNSNTLLNQIKNIAFTSIIWNIWCGRNSRLFKGIELPVQIRITHISHDYTQLMQTNLDRRKVNKELELIFANLEFLQIPSRISILLDFEVTPLS